ncbi:MAG: cbb3-type cytochrome c oxidase N-terminal domain-containing protein [Bacteroidota bacterium]
MKKIFSTLLILLLPSVTLLAQSTTEAVTPSLWDDPYLLFYISVGFMFIVILLVLTVAVYMLKVLNIMVKKTQIEKAAEEGREYKPGPTMWEKIWQGANNFVPVEKEATILLDHNYDGIRELDNHLPPWWSYLFIATIIWGAIYLFAYHVTDSLPLSIGEYDNEVAVANDQLQRRKAASPGIQIDENNVSATTDAANLKDGKSTFTSICASCHRVDGGGDIGPNLTDEYWKHGGTMTDVYKVVKNGVTGTNMVAWGGTMSPEKMRNVASYLLTLVGTNPVNGKKPEGSLFKAEPIAPKVDSVKVQASL